MKKILFILSIVSILTYQTLAQDVKGSSNSDENTKTEKGVQLSLLYPLGTSWTKSIDSSYSISLNILIGATGGVRFFEIAGVGNIVLGDVKYIQLAQFFNYVDGSVNGIQATAGLNVVKKDFRGIQAAVVGNMNLGDTMGFQTALLGNVNTGSTTGFQTALLGNVNTGNISGFQMALFGNVNTGNTLGFQMALFGNVNKHLTGIQMSFLNINYGNLFGEDTGQNTGLMIGLINIADNDKYGVLIPLGIINIIKDGVNMVSIGANDIAHTELSYRMGTRYLYSVVSFGLNYFNGISFADGTKGIYAGVGLGLMIPLERMSENLDKLTVMIEEVSYTAVNSAIISYTGGVYQTRLLLKYDVLKDDSFGALSIIVGPTGNIFSSRVVSDNVSPLYRIPFSEEVGMSFGGYFGVSYSF